jgi:hypothetical protein
MPIVAQRWSSPGSPDTVGLAGFLGVDHGGWVCEPRSGEARTGVAQSFVLGVGGRGHRERRVASDAVVERLDVLEDLGGQLAARGPGAAVREFLLSVAKKLSATALS